MPPDTINTDTPTNIPVNNVEPMRKQLDKTKVRDSTDQWAQTLFEVPPSLMTNV